MPRKPRPKEAPPEGVYYVTHSGNYYTDPQITADKVEKASRNNYITEQLDRLVSLLFCDYYSIRVVNEDAGEQEVDVELSDVIMDMFENKEVDVWTRMKQVWLDRWIWGCSFFNPVWEMQKGERVLTQLRRLPPETFSNPDDYERYVYSSILRGVSVEGGKVKIVQTQPDGTKKRLNNVILMKEPVDSEVAGSSKLVPIMPILSMLNFAHKTQMQKLNRDGAPIMYIKVTNPRFDTAQKLDDLKLAQDIIQNAGKDTGFQIPPNFEVVYPTIPSNPTAYQTVEKLENRLRDYVSPATLIKKQGETLGGNAAGETGLIKLWLRGQHKWLVKQFEDWGNEYLETNGYLGYRCYIDIPEPQFDQARLDMEKAQTGFNTKCLTVNERRSLLNQPPLEEDEIDKLLEEYNDITQPQMMMGGGTPGEPYDKDPQDTE
jgi:hypothetical protein